VIEVVMCQEERIDAFVTHFGLGEPVEDTAPAVEEEPPLVRLQ